MFSEIKGGTKVVIQEIYECWLPPEGYVIDIFTGELAYTGVYARSTNKDEQYWERFKLPDDYEKRRRSERKKQESDPDFVDQELESIRAEHWFRRLNGFWFYNNGRPTYITGQHYFYLNFWFLDGQYPEYRDPDREFFYCWLHTIENPDSLGMLEITNRRDGKSFRMGSIIYEKTSRTKYCYGGIQSKTDTDGISLFQNKIVSQFMKMPHFFKPMYDTDAGPRPKKKLRFFKKQKRGTKKEEEEMDVTDSELESWIEPRSSVETAFDGEKLHIYGRDEWGKTLEADVWKGHQVTKFCCMVGSKIVGKMLYSTTIEDLESGGQEAFNLVKNSRKQDLKPGEKRTVSGLTIYFKPAYKSDNYDKFGIPDEQKTRNEILAIREQLRDDPQALAGYIRKYPFTLEEAFSVDNERCHFNAIFLNERKSELSWGSNYTTRGNFEWVNGDRDTRVEFVPNKNGRWEVCWLFDDVNDSNKFKKNGSSYMPASNNRFVMGVDPYDHDVTVDNRRSSGAAMVLRKYSAIDEGDIYNHCFVAKYCYRPQTADIFYEDILKGAVYFGCKVLIEDNKPGIRKYFRYRGYGDFLIWLPGRPDAGVPGGPKTHQEIAEKWESYIQHNHKKLFFGDVVEDLLMFDVTKTTKYDLTMAGGYALIADDVIKYAPDEKKSYSDVKDFFRTYKVR